MNWITIKILENSMDLKKKWNGNRNVFVYFTLGSLFVSIHTLKLSAFYLVVMIKKKCYSSFSSISPFFSTSFSVFHLSCIFFVGSSCASVMFLYLMNMLWHQWLSQWVSCTRMRSHNYNQMLCWFRLQKATVEKNREKKKRKIKKIRSNGK